MATVTNHAKGARGFHTKDGRTVFLEPGETAEIDLAPLGPVEKAWVRAREIEITAPRSTPKVASDRSAGEQKPDTSNSEGVDQGADGNASGQSSQESGAPNPPKLKGSSQ